MPKAAKKNNTPRRTASLRKPPARPIVDPAFALIENHQKTDKGWRPIIEALDTAKFEAEKKHGRRPLALVSWRNHHNFGASEIDQLKNELLSLPGIDPETIETEYWDAKARLLGTELAGKEWDKRAGLTALRRDLDRANSAEHDAAWKMARTRPTTAAGAAALLAYIATDNGSGLFELGETPWHETAFRTVASLARITRKSLRAA